MNGCAYALGIGIFAIALHSDAFSAPILDQSVESGLNNAGGWVAANAIDISQTFTVAAEGLLTQVDIFIAKTGDTTDDLIVDLRAVNGEEHNATLEIESILASASVSAGAVNDWQRSRSDPWDLSQLAWLSVDFGPLGPFVSVGDFLAITLSSPETLGGYVWGFVNETASIEPYPRGHSYFRASTPSNSVFNRGGGDHLFRTFVTPVSEPGTLYLMIVSLLAILIAGAKTGNLQTRRGCDLRLPLKQSFPQVQ